MSETGIPDEGREVSAPSGASFFVLNEAEEAYFNDRATRYQSDNHFTNVSDLQDLDRVLVMELLCWRLGTWLSREQDYWGNSVDLDSLQKSFNEYSRELRQLKKILGIDKATRDKDKGESIADYIENLRHRAKEFGLMREEQSTKSITLFKELQALMQLHDNCDERERKEQHVDTDDVLDWIRTVAFVEFEEIDEYFRKNKQKYWIMEM